MAREKSYKKKFLQKKMQVSAFGRGELSVRHVGTRCYEKQIFGLGGAKIWSKACSFFGVPAVSV